MGELDGTCSHCSRTALNQHCASLDRAADMNSAVRSNARYSKTGTLLHRYCTRERYSLLQWHDNVFGGSTKRSIRLSAVAPDPLAHPLMRYAGTNTIYRTCTVAVRNDARIWHPHAKCVFA